MAQYRLGAGSFVSHSQSCPILRLLSKDLSPLLQRKMSGDETVTNCRKEGGTCSEWRDWKEIGYESF